MQEADEISSMFKTNKLYAFMNYKLRKIIWPVLIETQLILDER